ncbi:MAG: NapC/NirT family cytochrome c [Clostridia bacterium]|nr:NapC/NirT family cytochrome c [Clostridia bacterium]
MLNKSRTWGKIAIIISSFLALALVASFTTVRMTESPHFCASCHVMQPMYETHLQSTHSSITCNDCHTPQDNYLKKVAYKGISGTWDAYVYFTGQSPQIFETKENSKEIIQANCIRCHQDTVDAIKTTGGKKCFQCHRNTPHGERSQKG